MHILLLSEGDLIEDELILTRIPKKYRVDRAVLSKNVSFTNFFMYDIIIISFVPSFATPHFKLIETVLKLKKIVISMNMDQNNFYFEYFYRSKSFQSLCKLGLKLFIVNDDFKKFISKLNINEEKYKLVYYKKNNNQNYKNKYSNNLIFIMDLKWLSVTQKYIRYKKNVGYSDLSIKSAIKYSEYYIESFISNQEEILNNFEPKKTYIYFNSTFPIDFIKSMYGECLLRKIEIVNFNQLFEMISDDSIILTNWHSIELINFHKNIKTFRINFYFQNTLGFFKQVPQMMQFDENLIKVKDGKFDLILVKPTTVTIDLNAVRYEFIHVETGILSRSNALKRILRIYYYVLNSIILIAIQLRFIIYIVKKNINDRQIQ